MIFVTVGTHEQPFNRLIQKVDELKRDGVIAEDVFIQTGYSTYVPEFCKWSRLIPYKEVIKFVNEARIVITHGGPSSFMMPLQIGKIPVVVPRRHCLGEHVNNHQLEFAKYISEKNGVIIPVYDIDKLGDTIVNYDCICSNMNKKFPSNNDKFNREFEKVVEDMMK